MSAVSCTTSGYDHVCLSFWLPLSFVDVIYSEKTVCLIKKNCSATPKVMVSHTSVIMSVFLYLAIQ